MSSSATEPQPAEAAASIVTRLPPELWTMMFRCFDLESIFTVAEALPECKSLALSPTVVKTVDFDVETDERIITKFLQTTREEVDQDGRTENVPISSDVRVLRFTNCIALTSKAILECAQPCCNLRELYCVNCVVEPAGLFTLLSRTLKSVTKLEWTLYEHDYYESRLGSRALMQIEIVPASEGPNIQTMYVEQACSDVTVRVLNSFLFRCAQLCDLHIHDLRKKRLPVQSADACLGNFAPNTSGPVEIADQIPTLETFKFTCEMQLSINMERRLSVVRNNIAWQRKPAPSFNVVALADVLQQKVTLRNASQVMVTAKADSHAARLFEEAAGQRQSWKDVSCLTLVLTPEAGTEPSAPRKTCSVHMETLEQFFDVCVSQLTELNLSTCHFFIGSDCCSSVASTLRCLRSLTLPPCGVNPENSLETLAQGCKLLECLEVCSIDTVENAEPCEACESPLRFTESGFELLHRETRLRRLSIDETAQIVSLRFLLGCRVQELRLYVDRAMDEELERSPAALGQFLAANTSLSSLTLVVRKAAPCLCVAKNLAQVQSLRRLCVLTTTLSLRKQVEDFFFYLEGNLPRLQSVHVHCILTGNYTDTFTWIRRWRPDYATESGFAMWRTAKGVVLSGPCLSHLCCVDGFTGLPRVGDASSSHRLPLSAKRFYKLDNLTAELPCASFQRMAVVHRWDLVMDE
ncbi:hypothetical protein HPB50_021464 [Hyalomma asiaticum]|uniref:Uncharacterized protein n=1 Tax=Hyalomma asiaticum TaxID=266040 RepID=A0ACB7S1T7_HYAAI|nr:hypothetical protein HPB50_021464 [Hyalomma asiaticum]